MLRSGRDRYLGIILNVCFWPLADHHVRLIGPILTAAFGQSGPSTYIPELTPAGQYNIRIRTTNKGKPNKSWGRKATGPRFLREEMDDSPKDPRSPGCRHIGENSMTAIVRISTVLILSAILVSCGGGGGSIDLSGSGPNAVATEPGGIWAGTSTSQGVTIAIQGVITEDRDGRFVDENGTQYVVVGIFGNDGDITITFSAYAQFGYQFLDGSTSGQGRIEGTIVERSTFSGSFSFSTGESGTITMAYDPLYDRDSSLDKLSGSWDEGLGILTVDPNGSFFEQDQFGCIYNGQVSIIDAMFNAYRLTMTASNCGLDNGDYDGIGVLADLVVDGDEDLFIVQMNSNALIFTTSLERL